MIEGETVLLGGDVVLEVAGVPIFDEEPSPKARTLEAADRAHILEALEESRWVLGGR